VKKGWQLTEGSVYRILSIGARDSILETEGVFRGFATLGLDEVGLCIEQTKKRKKTVRIIPLHVILAIDVVSEKKKKPDKHDEHKEDLAMSYS